ncbi:MAG: lateral flagellar motor switch protein FliGL, partial [Aeromonas allosaccharophila]
PQTASAVLDALPGSVHDDLLVRVASLSSVSEHVLGELRLTLDRCLAYVADQSGAKVNGVRQVADILNRYQGDKEQMLSLLREHDGDMALEIEKNMFDFMALRRQTDDTLQRLVQELPSELLALALKNTETGFRKVILGAMPKRMAQALDDQIQNQGSVSLRKVEQAREEVMQLVRELVEQGEIEFQLFEEPTVS